MFDKVLPYPTPFYFGVQQLRAGNATKATTFVESCRRNANRLTPGHLLRNNQEACSLEITGHDNGGAL
ncbi:hypothetical protein K0M31_009959 [Melipona bicolor]|uniref:Uncharacterized protein n=1 Tax=Melipona bicolor TaxID=60889 RepID=A0AA40FNU7_9HYME|nr:hypothetical protein K0M31_009959 [Melipona bicolor]